MLALEPGDWVAERRPASSKSSPCMLVLEQELSGHYLCRYVWRDSGCTEPLTVEHSLLLHRSASLSNRSSFFRSYRRDELELLDGRRDAWPEGTFDENLLCLSSHSDVDMAFEALMTGNDPRGVHAAFLKQVVSDSLPTIVVFSAGSFSEASAVEYVGSDASEAWYYLCLCILNRCANTEVQVWSGGRMRGVSRLRYRRLSEVFEWYASVTWPDAFGVAERCYRKYWHSSE